MHKSLRTRQKIRIGIGQFMVDNPRNSWRYVKKMGWIGYAADVREKWKIIEEQLILLDSYMDFLIVR